MQNTKRIIFSTEARGRLAQEKKYRLRKLHVDLATNEPDEDAVYDLANKYIFVI